MSVPSKSVAVYDQPHQFEPLLPANDLGDVIEATRRIFEKSSELKASASPETRAVLREIVRSMNSYYSNRIEGQGTHPANIERALRKDFSDKADVAKGQRVALAHIEAEQELEQLVTTEAGALQSDFLIQAHTGLYSRLSLEDRVTDDGRLVVPGQLRTHDVAVGRHQPPAWQSVPKFLARMDERYGRLSGVDAVLYTVASAHHRMAWTHPFEDGNGRAVRLQTHCALLPINGGLWSVNRGLARQRERYYEMLDNADSARQGDLDGRGNLSQRMLLEWCRYFVSVCEDQVQFMATMLDLGKLKDRIRAYVLVRGATESITEYREEAILPLQTVAATGAMSRGDFIRMTGLEERTARKVISRFLADGILRSDGHRSPLSIGFPLSSLGILLPNLYPEASTVVID
ncbi:Fic family protein [Variovorax sp. J22R133]|uniref:Fic family protein n=1 Tax=Variovorax brevis TaxID=3053503 RepID=UPI002576A7D9|nr:Fic family protein [Variovorax sp. J22R133]MDM0112065.1 Fic family protein [Variovorax sp. J22R133]